MQDRTVTFTERESSEPVSIVRCITGPDTGAEVVVSDEPVIVGSGPEAGLRLSDRRVSRAHCELRREDGEVVLRDLKSKNGTWHGRLRIRETVLGAGANFRIGDSTLEALPESRKVRRPSWAGDRLGAIVGASPAMHRVFALVSRVAPTDAPVLITGETGTGKELVAREIHNRGASPDGPFVVVDAGAISRSLADLEIFGHEKGAFTGADRARPGAFERADGGTLFLDEIAELPLDLQPKLLRALESGTVQRIGASERREVNVRVVAATHRPVREMVNEKSFREDLFYRLAVVEVPLPALRQRRDDIGALARSFTEEFANDAAGAGALVDEALAKLTDHSWPGNVRELRGLVRRIVILGGTDLIDDFKSDEQDGPSIRTDLEFSEAKQLWIDTFEHAYLRRLLDETGGNITAAAERAGLNRSYLSTLVKRKQLRR